MGKKVPLIITAVLFIGAVFGVLGGFSVPEEKEEKVTHLTYTLTGDFAHQAFEKPAASRTPVANPRYFASIIDSINVSYNYRFVTEKPPSKVAEEVEIIAVVESRGGWGSWQKEVVLVPKSGKEGDFSISFPLDTAPLLELVTSISKELGVERGQPDITIKAIVHTKADTPAGTVEDDFIQTTLVKLSPITLEWDRNLAASRIGYAKGLRYEHQGNFSYTINLKPNNLFIVESLGPDTPPPVELVAAKSDKPSYKRETLQNMKGTFTYNFESSVALKQVDNEVEITATMGTESFVLAPKTKQKENKFEVPFQLDIPFYYAVARSFEAGTGKPAFPYGLNIAATVHTVGQSEFGKIDETLTKNVLVNLGNEEIIWPAETTAETKSGAIEETVVVPNSGATTAKVGTLGLLGMTTIAFLYTAWSFRESRRRYLTRIQIDDLQVKGKYQSLVVDVQKLPDTGNHLVVELGSLAELTRTADSLLKPVLRLVETDKRTYCVIEGNTRYQYISQDFPPKPPAEATT
jgi:hypothetical protein